MLASFADRYFESQKNSVVASIILIIFIFYCISNDKITYRICFIAAVFDCTGE